MRLMQRGIAALLTLALAGAVTAQDMKPEVSFSGYLDADVWTDLAGNFYSNNELDLGMSIGFTENVSANFYATVVTGDIPAGFGMPGDDRWAAVAFDGLDVTWEAPFATFTIGDLVYQYGGFNYYLYKRISMITPENFTRGLQVSFGSETFSQDIGIGSADSPMTGDIFGSSTISPSDAMSIALYYGLRGSIVTPFEDGTNVFGGLEYNGSFGEMLEVKLDLGYRNVPDGIDADSSRDAGIAVLAEPTVSMGDFSVALSAYAFIADSLSTANLIGEEFYTYIEPGYSFTETFAFGLPLEIHAATLDDIGGGEFWTVPTAYLYPADNVEWWLWGQVVVPFEEDENQERNLSYGLGSEIIVTF